MKLTNTRKAKSPKGMTLLELTVVILVLLSLISILFIGARAWKRGSDRAGCILIQRNVQQAVRSHANMQGINTAGTFTITDVFSPDKFIEKTEAEVVADGCPDEDGVYSFPASGTVPAVGTMYLRCTLGTYSTATTDGTGHAPKNSNDW